MERKQLSSFIRQLRECEYTTERYNLCLELNQQSGKNFELHLFCFCLYLNFGINTKIECFTILPRHCEHCANFERKLRIISEEERRIATIVDVNCERFSSIARTVSNFCAAKSIGKITIIISLDKYLEDAIKQKKPSPARADR